MMWVAAACWLAAVSACAPQLGGMRINKVFTATFSRREADRLVASGRVAINGVRASNGDRVTAGDAVTLDGAPFSLPVAAELNNEDTGDAGHLYLKYWKPRGVTCTTDARVTGNIIDALAFPGPERLFPVGRLDKDSEGLILLTNDGRLPNAINRAKFAHKKLYEVECDRPLGDAHLRQLANGVVITTMAQRDRGPPKVLTAPTLPCEVRRLGARAFDIVLTEGRNRQIRRMCEAIGFTVVRLHRKSVIGIGLSGLDGPGAWTHLQTVDLSVVNSAIDGALTFADDADASCEHGEVVDEDEGEHEVTRATAQSRQPRVAHVDTWSRYRGSARDDDRGRADVRRGRGGRGGGAQSRRGGPARPRGRGTQRGGRGTKIAGRGSTW